VNYNLTAKPFGKGVSEPAKCYKKHHKFSRGGTQIKNKCNSANISKSRK